MKNLAMLMLCLCWLGANATSWRVNNNPGINADFATFQAAHDAASAGDTIYVEGTPISYGACVLSKKLVVIGPGYFLLENDSTQANAISAVFESLVIDTTASGSHVYGCQFNATTGVRINGSNVVFSRNYIPGYSGIHVGHENHVTNCVISQNYTTRIQGSWYSYHPIAYNTLIINNIVTAEIKFGQTAASCTVLNNVVGCEIYVQNSVVKNNIHYSNCGIGFVQNSGNTFRNNLTIRNTIPPGTGNQTSIDPNLVFIDFNGSLGYSTDGKFQLNPAGPAVGAGENGTDCGVFGGTASYVLSGLAPIPRIYEADVPASGSAATGLPVTIKVKSQN